MSSESSAITVRLLGLPVQLHLTSAAHLEALRREFDVVQTGDEDDSVPQRLRSLMSELGSRYRGLDGQPSIDLDAAIEQGAQTTDVEVEVESPADASDIIARLLQLLEDADEYCRDGEHLLTLASSPESAAYRRWFLGEFIAQIGGADPVPWHHVASPVEDVPAAPAAPSAGPSPSYRIPPGWSVEDRGSDVVVRPSGELDLQTAPELRDLVQAVRREHTARVELDLGGVSFIDSVGLSMIVSAHQRLDADGVALSVVVPPMLQRLFDISGLGQLLDLRH